MTEHCKHERKAEVVKKRRALAEDLATAGLNALPHEIRLRMGDMAKAHHVLVVAAIEAVLAEQEVGQ